MFDKPVFPVETTEIWMMENTHTHTHTQLAFM